MKTPLEWMAESEPAMPLDPGLTEELILYIQADALRHAGILLHETTPPEPLPERPQPKPPLLATPLSSDCEYNSKNAVTVTLHLTEVMLTIRAIEAYQQRRGMVRRFNNSGNATDQQIGRRELSYVVAVLEEAVRIEHPDYYREHFGRDPSTSRLNDWCKPIKVRAPMTPRPKPHPGVPHRPPTEPREPTSIN